MVYHFVKHIGFDIKADSLEQAKEIAGAIDDYDDEGNSIKDVAMYTMLDAINDALDVGVLREDFYDNCDAHVGNTEYVGYTDDADDDDDFDAEKDFFNYLIDADDEDDEDVCYILTDKGRDLLAHLRGENPDFDENDYDARGKRLTKTEDSEDAIADAIANAIISAFLSAMIG